MKAAVRQVEAVYAVERDAFAIVVRDVKQNRIAGDTINETKTGSIASLLQSPDDIYVSLNDAERLMTALWQAGCRPNNLNSIDTLEYHIQKVKEFSSRIKQLRDEI